MNPLSQKILLRLTDSATPCFRSEVKFNKSLMASNPRTSTSSNSHLSLWSMLPKKSGTTSSQDNKQLGQYHGSEKWVRSSHTSEESTMSTEIETSCVLAHQFQSSSLTNQARVTTEHNFYLNDH